MAGQRRPSLLKIKAKKQSKSKSEQYLINHTGFGSEPLYTSKLLTVGELSRRLTWYNSMCDTKEARQYLTTYLKNAGRDSDVKLLRDVPDKWLPLTACWIARMLSSGAHLEDSTKEFFEDRVHTYLHKDYSKKNEMEEVDDAGQPAVARPKVKLSVQDRMMVILDGLICDLEEKLDDFITNWTPGFEMYTWLQANEVPLVQAKRIHDYYNPQLVEIEDYYEGRLDEGYDGYTKEQLTKLFGFYVMIVEDLEQYMQNSKKVRKSRTPKPMSMDKKLKDFKHKSFDNIRKIQSIQPAHIIHASELWTFSTKYNQLTVFRMDPNGSGLDVHRTAITGFDPKTSITKKLKAKDVDAVLKEVQGAGKVVLRNLMTNTRGSVQKLQERMNDATLLLRVVSK